MGGLNSSPSSTDLDKQKISFDASQSSPLAFKSEKAYKIDSSKPELVAKGIETGIKNAGQSIISAQMFAASEGANSTAPDLATTDAKVDFSQVPAEMQGVGDGGDKEGFMKEMLAFLTKNNQSKYE